MYKVLEIEITHNKRLRSGLIESLVYKPESLFQIIIGPNGVGKSAVLDEITAFPSEGGAFDKNGISRLKIETDEGIVETKSLFTSGGKHEFWLNGENLNDGGTAAVQKDLVQKHFKMDKVSFTVANGQFSFSKVKPTARQEILTQLGDNDLTFAYNLYNKARKKFTHATGAVNALNESLVEKETMDLTDEVVGQLQGRLNDYQHRVTELLTDLGHQVVQPGSLQSRWSNLNHKVKQTAANLPNVPLNAISRELWAEKIHTLEDSLLRVKTQQNALGEEFDGLSDILKRSADSSEENLERLRNELVYLDNELVRLDTHPIFDHTLFSGYDKCRQAAFELNQIFDEWKQVLGEIPSDSEGRFTREYYVDLKDRKIKFQNHYNALSAKRATLMEQLEHLDSGKEVHCPKCKLIFIPGVSSDSRPRLTANLEEIATSLKKGEEAIRDIESDIAQVELWLDGYRKLIGLEKVCPSAAGFFQCLQKIVDVKAEPLRAIHVGLNLLEQTVLMAEKERFREKRAETFKLLKTLEVNIVSGIEGVQSRYAKVKETLGLLTVEQLSIQKQLSDFNTGLQKADNYERSVDSIVKEYGDLVVSNAQEVENLFNQTREILIQDLQGHIGTLTKTLNDVKTLRDQIADNRVQLERWKKKVEGYKHLAASLSPKSGLVAEQMNEFISVFIAQVNEVIAEIWTYPMEILVGKPTDTELTYVFPIKLHDDNSLIVPDLKDASDGQSAIVDFAFQITAMLYKGLVNVPLLLDEVDRPMEPAHKERLMRFITSGVENGRFSQVFLVSHHAISHGALPFPDIADFNFLNPDPKSNKVITFQ